MKFNRVRLRIGLLLMLIANIALLSTHLRADTGTCAGQMITIPFTDVSAGSVFFCSIAEAYFSALTNGTTSTTYGPSDPVLREQMAAFVTRTMDQSIKRSSRRAALGEWWINQSRVVESDIPSGGENPQYLACDGMSVWVSNTTTNNVTRIDIKTGQIIANVVGIPQPEKIVIVSGNAYIPSFQASGALYFSDITATGTTGPFVSRFNVGVNPVGVTYDGQNFWTANFGTGPGSGAVSRFGLITTSPLNTFTQGFSQPYGILFDGANLWVTDRGDTGLKRVDISTGAVLQTIPLTGVVGHPVFDGTNLWIPCSAIAQLGVPDKVFVVRGVGGLTGTVLAQLTGNGLNGCQQAAFDGERIMVANTAGQSVCLWKASDLSPIASVNLSLLDTSFNPRGVCSDGVTFFIGLRNQNSGTNYICRF